MQNQVRYATRALNEMSEDQIRALQWKRLQRQIHYCLDNSTFYRERFRVLGLEAGDIKSLDDFIALPIILNKDLERQAQGESIQRLGHPYSTFLCCDESEVALTATTSGTTGVPTFTYTMARQDLSILDRAVAEMLGHAGILPGDRVLFAYALGVYATSAMLPPLRSTGVLPIDVDVRAGAQTILQFMQLTKPTALMTTPSLAQYLIEKSEDLIGVTVGEFGLQALFTVGEIGIGIPEVKERLEGAYGCRVYDWIAPFAQTFAFSGNTKNYVGMYAITPDTDLYPLDLIDPVTGKHIDIVDGVVGEAVCTSLVKRARPVLKYATGDIVRVHLKECSFTGFRGPRFEIIGRSDDMLIVKGTNVYPGAIKEIVNEFVPDVSGEIRIVLSQKPPRVEPPLVVRVERGRDLRDPQVKDIEIRLKQRLHDRVHVTPVIEWVDYGSLGISMRKTPIFEKLYE